MPGEASARCQREPDPLKVREDPLQVFRTVRGGPAVQSSLVHSLVGSGRIEVARHEPGRGRNMVAPDRNSPVDRTE